jgi:hypothetical protein
MNLGDPAPLPRCPHKRMTKQELDSRVIRRVYEKLAAMGLRSDSPLYKNAASRWATELLRKPTSELVNLVQKRLPQSRAVSLSRVPSPQAFNLNASFDTPVKRQALLRVLRGDYADMPTAFENLAKEQYARSVIKHRDLARETLAVSIPYNTKTTAFRGTSGGQYVQGMPRSEYFENGKLVHTGIPDAPVHFASRPEFAAAYARALNGKRLIPSEFPKDESPLALDQRFVAQFNLDDVHPILNTAYGKIMQKLKRAPWTAASLNPPYELRNTTEQLRAYLDARKRGTFPLRRDYELQGIGHGIPYQALYRVNSLTAKPKFRDVISPFPWIRAIHAKNHVNDLKAPFAGLTKTELLEPVEHAVRRSLSFYNVYNK